MDLLLSHCSSAFPQNYGVFPIFFFAGLLGSLTHCLVMCGPFVACQSTACRGCARFEHVLGGAYHLGRFLGYGTLGFFSAFLSLHLSVLPFWPFFSGGMLCLAGGIFFLNALFPDRHAFFKFSYRGRFVQGILMSFMPCGLLYAALMMTATLANPWAGMLAMWLFVLGTLPALVLVSSGVAVCAVKWENIIFAIGRFGMVVNGVVLFVMAFKRMR